MLRTGSITTTLAVAVIATVGLVGGGYALVTGNSICSLASACDTKPAATQVADTTKKDCAESKASSCSSPKVVAASDASQCSKPGAKTIAASDKADCATACSGAKVVAASDASQCSKPGAKTIAASDKADCATACSGAKVVAASDASQCSKSKAVNVADASQCSKPGAKTIAASDKADCATACSGAKAVAASDASQCSKPGAKAVAVADYECSAEAKFCNETMTKRAALHEALMPRIQGVSEIETGYAIDFPACSDTLVKVAEMVAMGRDCCEFLNYQIVAAANGGPVQLVMTGDAGAKAFLAKTLGPMVTQVSDASQCSKPVAAIADASQCSKAAAAVAVAASDACCASTAKPAVAESAPQGNVTVTKISIADACCEKGVKAVKAGLSMPKCCVTTDSE